MSLKPYMRSQRFFGELVDSYFSRKYGINFVACRFPAVVGPGRVNGGTTAYTTLIIQKAAQGEPYTVNVPEDTKLPLIYVKDAVDLMVQAYKQMDRLKCRIYNVGGVQPTPKAIEIAEAVKKLLPEAQITFKPDPAIAEIVKSWPEYMDDTELKQELGWKPQFPTIDAVAEDFIKEVKNHPDLYKV